MIDLLSHVIKEPCFNQLRTVEQLGYIVFSGSYTNACGIDFIRIIIQSSKMGPDALDDRIEHFLTLFRVKLDEMDTIEFDMNKTAVQSNLREKVKTPWGESLRYWGHITTWKYDFESRLERAEALEKVTKRDLLDFFDTYVAKDGVKRCKLSCQVFGKDHAMTMTEQSTTTTDSKEEPLALQKNLVQISNLDEFKRRMPLFQAQGNPKMTTHCFQPHVRL